MVRILAEPPSFFIAIARWLDYIHVMSGETRRVLWITFWFNLIVALVKVGAGWVVGSTSMVADGFHSTLDTASNIIGLISLWLASLPADHGHPYGHRKFETMATLIIAVFLFVAAYAILERTLVRWGHPLRLSYPGVGVGIMAVALAVDLLVSRYERVQGDRLKSDFLRADALHTKSHAFTSSAVILAIVCAQFGLPKVDAVFAIGIALFIAYYGIQVLIHASQVLVDTAVLPVETIRTVTMSVKGVKDCHRIRSRGREDDIQIDLHMHVDPQLTVKRAHEIASRVEAALKEALPGVSDVTAHVEPVGDREEEPG